MALVALGLSVVAPMSSPVHASGAFICQPGFYQVISGQLKILNPLTGVYSDIGTDLDDYNAIGYNPVDNFIYGWGSSGVLNDLVVRIDSAGSVTTLGAAGQAGTNFISADFDDAGQLWLRKSSTVMTRMNVSVNPATSVDVTFTGSSLAGADMGWINDVMYSVEGATLTRADLNTLTVTTATIVDLGSPPGKDFATSIAAGASFGAVFSNRADELYVSHNASGRIYKITDYTTSNPRATWVVDATVTSNNDGAACKLAPSPFDTPVSANDTYTTANDSTLSIPLATGIFSNDGATSPTVAAFTNPSSGTLTLNNDGSFSYTPAADFVGSVSFTYDSQDRWGRTVPRATVTITVTAGATTTTSSTTSTTVAPTTTTSTTVAPTTTTGSTTTATPTTVATSKDKAAKSELPQSGGESGLPFGIAVVCILAGVALIGLRRRLT
jgi:hypothetical protein